MPIAWDELSPEMQAEVDAVGAQQGLGGEEFLARINAFWESDPEAVATFLGSATQVIGLLEEVIEVWRVKP